MVTSRDPAYVLYVDHQGHPSPLSECFHATASRRLSSTADRINRPSTVTQVDSAYCPQSLSFYDASSATTLGYSPSPACLQCPICTSIVSCKTVESFSQWVFSFDCGNCDWNSTQCGLQVDAKSSTPSKEEVEEAVTQLTTQLQEKRSTHGKSAEEHYQKMVAAWETSVKSASARRTKSGLTSPRGLQFAKIGHPPLLEKGAWSVEALEEATQAKTKKLQAVKDEIVGGQALQRISLEEEQTLDEGLQGKPIESLVLQALTGVPTRSMADLLPLPVPLRSRKSRRCRAELAEGKPGILLKPKLNPLEGDSSLRTGHGQWWKKDSSAVHVLPRVRAVKHGSKAGDDNTQQHAFVLKVTNPTLGLVRLQIGLSAYSGESHWDQEPNGAKNPVLESLLVETLTNTHVDAYLLTVTKTKESSKFMSELVVLDSAEDNLVDIGKVSALPDEVTNWDAEKVLAEAPAPSEGAPQENKVSFSHVKKLAEKSGSAWFELICSTNQKVEEGGTAGLCSAIPISLQIEVGNGSWESSLIKKVVEGDKPDLVSFDLVLTFPSSQKE